MTPRAPDTAMPQPLVSVVIPCFNAAPFLKRTLASVLRSDYRPLEILVVNDGSTDGSGDIARSLGARHPGLQVLDLPNGGVSRARNAGVRAAQGEYVAFLDADDLFFPDSLGKRLAPFLAGNEPDLVGTYCPLLIVDQRGEPLRREPIYDTPLHDDRHYFHSSPSCVCNTSQAVVLKRAIVEAGLFDETICPAEDYDLWHRMLRAGGVFRIVRDCFVGWVQHPGSATHARIRHHHDQVRRAVDRIFSADPVLPVPADPDYTAGLGAAHHRLARSQNAFESAILAAVSGDLACARAIAETGIDRLYLRSLHRDALPTCVQIQAIRAHCTPERRFHDELWPRIRGDVEAVVAHLVPLGLREDTAAASLAALRVHVAFCTLLADPDGSALPQLEPADAAWLAGRDAHALLFQARHVWGVLTGAQDKDWMRVHWPRLAGRIKAFLRHADGLAEGALQDVLADVECWRV